MSAGSHPPVSEALRRFVAEAPWEREPILRFIQDAAGQLPRGARVLDVGAGEAPYRELFEHADYSTLDWENSPHAGARTSTIVSSAESMNVADGSFDAVILTQVLEHVLHPQRVLLEVRRVLRPGGSMYATVPFAWELHEEPHDYWRYSSYALRALLADARMEAVSISPRGNSMITLAQLMINVSWTLPANSSGEQAAAALRELAAEVATLGPLDDRALLPLGYQVHARRGEPD